MLREELKIVPLEESQIEAAGAAMARAFFDDPVMAYMFPYEAERSRLSPWHFSAHIRYGYLFGEVYTTSGNPDGTAVWFRPGQTDLTGSDMSSTPRRLIDPVATARGSDMSSR